MMLLPLFMTCDTLDFSHSIGSVNSPWNAIFIYERFPHGLGFTEKAYDALHDILTAVRETIHSCPCEDGCPCCVGKPLRQYTTWNVERGEAQVPSKKAALHILDGLMPEGANLRAPDRNALSDHPLAETERLKRSLGRRMDRSREPRGFFTPSNPAWKRFIRIRNLTEALPCPIRRTGPGNAANTEGNCAGVSPNISESIHSIPKRAVHSCHRE